MKLEEKFKEIRDSFTNFSAKLFFPSNQRKIVVPSNGLPSSLSEEKLNGIKEFFVETKDRVNEIIELLGIMGIFRFITKLYAKKFTQKDYLIVLNALIESLEIVDDKSKAIWGKTLKQFKEIADFQILFFIMDRDIDNISFNAIIMNKALNRRLKVLDFIEHAYYSKTLYFIFKLIVRESILALKKNLDIRSLKEVDIPRFSPTLYIEYIEFRKLLEALQPSDKRAERIINDLVNEYREKQKEKAKTKEEEIEVAEEQEETNWEETIAQGISEDDEEEKDYIEPKELDELKEIIESCLKEIEKLLKIVKEEKRVDLSKYEEPLSELKKEFLKWSSDLEKRYKEDPKKTTIDVAILQKTLTALSMEILGKLLEIDTVPDTPKSPFEKILLGLKEIDKSLEILEKFLYESKSPKKALDLLTDTRQLFGKIRTEIEKLRNIKEMAKLMKKVKAILKDIENMVEKFKGTIKASLIPTEKSEYVEEKFSNGVSLLKEGLAELLLLEDTNPTDEPGEGEGEGEPGEEEPPDSDIVEGEPGEGEGEPGEEEGDFPIETEPQTEELIEEQEKEKEEEKGTEEEQIEKEKELEEEIEKESSVPPSTPPQEPAPPTGQEPSEEEIQMEEPPVEQESPEEEGGEEGGAETEGAKPGRKVTQVDIVRLPDTIEELQEILEAENVSVEIREHTFLSDISLMTLTKNGKTVELSIDRKRLAKERAVTMNAPEYREEVKNINEILTLLE